MPNFRYHYHSDQFIIDDQTGDPIQLEAALTTIEVTEEIAQNFYNETSITQIVNEITEVTNNNSYIEQITNNATYQQNFLTEITELTEITQNTTYITNLVTQIVAQINGKKGAASELATLDADTQLTHAQVPSELRVFAIPYVIDGGGSAISTGSKGFVVVPFAATVTGWRILGDISGSIVVTVKRATYANFPTFTAISGTEKPTLSSAQKNEDTNLTTWTTSLSAGDILEFSVDSATDVTRALVSITASRSF